MSDAANPQPATVDENAIEAGVRDILTPLDRKMDRLLNVVIALWIFVVTPGATYLLTAYCHFDVWVAFGTGLVGGLVVLMALNLQLDGWLARGAVRRFNECFLEGTPQRPVALRILSEMESPSKAEQKLRDALQTTSPTERIVRHRREAPDDQVNAALNQMASPPTALPPAPPSTPAPHTPGGAFDYMPLRPREGPAEGDKLT